MTLWALLAAALALAPVAGRHPGNDDLAVKRAMAEDGVTGVNVYAEANKALIASGDRRPRIVLMGDSITFHWPPERVAGAMIVNRGIPGQTSGQMLLRFEDDVVALDPAAVVLLAGTNDLRVFDGPPAARREQVIRRIARNVTAMADIAHAHRIPVVVCALPPMGRSQAGIERDPATIVAVNDWLRGFAKARAYRFLDYHAVLVGPDGLTQPDLTSDGLHLTDAGYRALRTVLEPALRKAARR